tara:strand:- start:1300 stop:2499 length:1200 start_codon:yes stop_codon:yes gene_type:complete
MGTFSEKELSILDYIVDFVNFEIFCIEQDVRDKDKLDYSLCSDNFEKHEVTKKKVAKFKSKIDKCNPNIAGYLIEFSKPTPKGYDFYDWRDKITKNFVISIYTELIEELSIEDIDDIDELSFSSIIKSKGYKYKPLKEYIQGVCDVNHYSIYKSFLEIPLNENIVYKDIITKLNNAFFRLEAFMKGTVTNYYHFDFNRAFTELFYFTRKTENFTYENCKRIGEYWKLIERISVDYDQSDFENTNAHNNKAFNNNCDVLTSINWHRVEEFVSFATPDELEAQTKKMSISDLINTTNKSTEVINQANQENKYPRIFKDYNAYSIFQNLLNEFGNTKENLSNYSYAFHKMTYEGLINYDILQKTYFNMLSEFDISIDRIKPESEIGKIALRDSIYNKAKSTT